MDTIALVENQIDDGLRLINRLTAGDFDMSVACWVKTSEEGDWFLYIASKTVDEKGLAAAYREVYRVIQSMPDIWIPKSQVKLIGRENPIAKDALEIQRRFARKLPTRYPGPQLGNIAIEEAYFYPMGRQEGGVKFLGGSELELLVGEAVRNTAARLGIADALFFSVDELREQVKVKDPQASSLLEAFINAYWQWFDFHRRVESLGKQGRLDADEHQQLAVLVGQRNRTREALLNYIHNLNG
jgi:hypothetical protein